MKIELWITEQNPKHFFKELIRKNNDLTFWDVFNNYNPQRIEYEDGIEYFDYPRINLAKSNTFYGFNNDLGNLSYEERDKFVNEKFEQYKSEIIELLKQSPNDTLQPKLDYRKIDTDEKIEYTYWDTIETNPFMHEFEGSFAAWRMKEKVIFLSVNQEDKELPYEINLGGLVFEKYNELLEKFNKITG